MRLREHAHIFGGEVMLACLSAERFLARHLGLLSLYRRHIGWLVRRLALFDEIFYLENNADVAQVGMPALQHYVRYGDREGRGAMPLFDVPYYRAHANGCFKNINALLHYAYVGRHRRISPSAWFDVGYYLGTNKDVARSGAEPLYHYIHTGGREGRAPCPQFDSRFYLNMYPDVAENGINPLIHYLRTGRAEGRCVMPGPGGQPMAGRACHGHTNPLERAEWDMLSPPRDIGLAKESASVDVIVPVYRGRLETLRCLCSLLKSRATKSFEIIVINDASPEPELTADLQKLARRGLITLLTNTKNLGFVATVNRGMALHPERDVTLLNADTEVYGDWLDRLNRAAYRNEHTGTVTPLSNNATVCSYPVFLHDNPYPLEIGYSELDALAAQVNAGAFVETPSAVGFCMYIKRSCLDAIGGFDAEAYGRGYGEDNDFSQRAIANGWKNLIAVDVFVRHIGSVSFQGEKTKRIGTAMAVLSERYPDYRTEVASFIASDPLAAYRERLDWARMLRRVQKDNVLVVSHGRGGGCERHVQEDIARFNATGRGTFLLRPKSGQSNRVCLNHPDLGMLPNIPPFELGNIGSLIAALKQLKITAIHVHSLVDLAASSTQHVVDVARELGVKLDFNVHDYTAICPRINLANRMGLYCGEPDERACNRCLRREGSEFGVTNIRAWRADYHAIFQVADNVLVPDRDVAERLGRYYPDVQFKVSPHEDIDSMDIKVRQLDLMPEEPLRIVVIGSIGRIKGFGVLMACAIDAARRKLPLEYILLGYSLDDGRLEEAGVQVTGRYLEHESEIRLTGLQPHVAWLPSVWPETYSYTLSIALKAGYPVMAFDIGAIGSRLRAARLGNLLMPMAYVGSAEKINNRFMAYRSQSTRGLERAS